MKDSILTLLIIVLFSFYGCVPDPSDEGKEEYLDSSEIPPPSSEIAKDTLLTIKARFMDFKFGDISHYIFEDAEGFTYDFIGNEDKTYHFETAVTTDKQNEENQGWNANDDFIKKWFHITYYYTIKAQYPDGPMTRQMVIKEVELIKK